MHRHPGCCNPSVPAVSEIASTFETGGSDCMRLEQSASSSIDATTGRSGSKNLNSVGKNICTFHLADVTGWSTRVDKAIK